MTGDLVPACGKLTDQASDTVRHPTENEEGGLDVVFVEQVQQLVRVALDPEGVVVPVRATDAVRKRRDMEVVLDVDS